MSSNPISIDVFRPKGYGTVHAPFDGNYFVKASDSYSVTLIPSAILSGAFQSVTGFTTNYTFLDNDYIYGVEGDTTSGDVTFTLPLLANNQKRIIEIASVKGSNKVIISPNATDTNTLSSDGLNSVYLPKNGDRVLLFASPVSGKWEFVNERITCQYKYDTHAGYGSTNIKIPYFTNNNQAIGNLITSNSNSTNGLSITINKSGRYSIKYIFVPPSLAALYQAGISINSSQLSTSVGSITNTTILALNSQTSSAQGVTFDMSVSLYLNSNDIIRPHTDGNLSATPANCQFFVTYLGM